MLRYLPLWHPRDPVTARHNGGPPAPSGRTEALLAQRFEAEKDVGPQEQAVDRSVEPVLQILGVAGGFLLLAC